MSKAVYLAHFEQIWNNKDASGIERFIARNYRGFDAAEAISGVEGYKQHFVTITTAFPDMRITTEIILGEDLGEEERVGARWLVEATHTGPFGDIPPTGRRVRLTGTSVALIRTRQIVEEHANSDALGLLKQIGVIPDSVKVVPLIF